MTINVVGIILYPYKFFFAFVSSATLPREVHRFYLLAIIDAVTETTNPHSASRAQNSAPPHN